jgi:hypothetical protein
MIDLPVVVFVLSFGIKISVGIFNNCEDCAMGGEGMDLLWRLLDFRWRLWR